MAKATDTITDSEDIVKLAKPGDYYQVRTHHMFSRILNFLFLFVKFMFSKKATKIDKIFTVDLTVCSKCQIVGEDFLKFCGLLRKYEL